MKRQQVVSTDGSTMASQLGSNNSKYQASKFSTYEDGTVQAAAVGGSQTSTGTYN